MIFLSFVINALIFLLVFNLGFSDKKKKNHQTRSLSKTLFFPLALAVAFTLLIDIFKGLFVLQILLFLMVAALLYYIFFIFNKTAE